MTCYKRLQNLLNMARAKKNKYNHFEHASFNDDLITALVDDTGNENPEQWVLRKEREKELVDIVNALHPLLRDIIILRFQGYDNEYISKQYDVSKQTIVIRFSLIRKFMATRPSFNEIKAFNEEFEKRLRKGVKHGSKRDTD